MQVGSGALGDCRALDATEMRPGIDAAFCEVLGAFDHFAHAAGLGDAGRLGHDWDQHQIGTTDGEDHRLIVESGAVRETMVHT